MLGSVGTTALLLLSVQVGLSSAARDAQTILTPPSDAPHGAHVVDSAILAALEAYPDPVDALVSLQPELAAGLAEPRLLCVPGEDAPEWMTEGDKLRLRRLGKKFVDITEHRHFYAQQAYAASGKACTSIATVRPKRS